MIDEWLETYQSTIHLMSLLSMTNVYGLDMERYHEGSVLQYKMVAGMEEKHEFDKNTKITKTEFNPEN